MHKRSGFFQEPINEQSESEKLKESIQKLKAYLLMMKDGPDASDHRHNAGRLGHLRSPHIPTDMELYAMHDPRIGTTELQDEHPKPQEDDIGDNFHRDDSNDIDVDVDEYLTVPYQHTQ